MPSFTNCSCSKNGSNNLHIQKWRNETFFFDEMNRVNASFSGKKGNSYCIFGKAACVTL